MAYYHDIGKLAKPDTSPRTRSVRRAAADRLTPSMSALIVRSHITGGVEMARKNRLPRVVIDSIPEHHGTMVMAFFFHKALEQDPTIRSEEFSYPGPRPRSKETAILMLADGVEGASRALAEPTPSRIRGLIARILQERIQQGQLDERPHAAGARPHPRGVLPRRHRDLPRARSVPRGSATSLAR
jgi:putative nucleotidyltransferase with HDIG domain